MPKPYHLELTMAQRDALVPARTYPAKPYVRARAAAILKVAAPAPAAKHMEIGASGLTLACIVSQRREE